MADGRSDGAYDRDLPPRVPRQRWASFPRDCRSAARRHTIPGHGYHYLGLRVALVAAASVSPQERLSPNEAPLAKERSGEVTRARRATSSRDLPATKEHGPSGSATSQSVPSVEGSTWRFPGAAGKTTATTVEFLGGGRFRWSGKLSEGFWKQDGALISINVNEYTLFRLTIDGDTMRGTWERLQGEDAGQKYPSSLHRVTEGAVPSGDLPLAKEPAASGNATAPNVPRLEGSKWQFPYSKVTKKATTVEFLDGGRFRSDGTLANGFWKQNGKEVVINMNDFTLFRLTIDGDTMRGTWERLHGEDAGEKNPSVLHRATD